MPIKYYVRVPKTPKKSLNKIPMPWQVRILDALTELETSPYLGERMQGKYSDQRKIKVWPYRILYTINEKIKQIDVLEIEHRGHISYD